MKIENAKKASALIVELENTSADIDSLRRHDIAEIYAGKGILRFTSYSRICKDVSVALVAILKKRQAEIELELASLD